MTNYTLQDISGSLLATIIFPIVFLIPGYVIGWLLNVFEFRSRLLATQHLIGIVLSTAVSPILLFLLFRFASADIALACLFIFAIIYIALIAREVTKRVKNPITFSPFILKYQRITVLIAGVAAVLSITLLVDLQIQNRLYFSALSYDLTTRVSVVDAITRTGVPPINPGYYPGKPVQLTYLYYFWYILGSVVDRLGGGYISAYQSMIASIVWCGFSLAATLAVYLHLRSNEGGLKIRQLALIAAQLILVGGLDFIPVATFTLGSRLLFGHMPYEGRIEGWNTPIMSWMNAINWVPHHVASALACLTAMMLFIHSKDGNIKQKMGSVVLIGLAFASAFGLSVWVTLAFAIFWGIWMLVITLQKTERKHIWAMGFAGILGLIFVSPFLAGIFQPDSSSSGGNFPIAFYVRPFMASSLLGLSSRVAYRIANLLFLPLNYFFELGLFFIMAIMWIKAYHKPDGDRVTFFTAEIILVITTTIFLTFIYSTVIAINDLGIRGWLPLQFILVVWAADLIHTKMEENKVIISPSIFKKFSRPRRLAGLLSFLFVIGFMTSLLEVVNTRAWPILVDLNIVGFPNELSPDTRLGERTLAARSAYDYIRDHVPDNTIIQNNPLTSLDRPSGLYGDHQMAIADRTAYGVPADEFKRITEEIGNIFNNQYVSDWSILDETCNNFSIDVIVVNDIDPLWSSVDKLSTFRPPIYKNNYYAVFSCGD